MDLSCKDLSRYFLCYLGVEGTSWGWYTVFPFSATFWWIGITLLCTSFSVIGQEYVSRVVNVFTGNRGIDLLYTCKKGASNEAEVTMNVTPALLYK